MKQWTNWAGTEFARPNRTHRPRTSAEAADVITTAAATGRRVHTLGSRHSFSAIGTADSASEVLDLRHWTGIVDADLTGGIVTVRAGTTLRKLNAELDALGLALTNLGDIDGQTVAGAISTGTHGTGSGFTGLAAQVVGLEMILADGSFVTCSEHQHPDLFAAARLGLGALGVITTVTLRCEPAFALAAQEHPEPLEQVLEGFDELADNHDHFEFYWFPYGHHALVKQNNRLAPDQTPQPLSRFRRFADYTLMENAAFGTLCRISRAIPRLTPQLGRLSSAALSAREYSDVSHRVFTTPRTVRFVESEFAVPRETVLDVLTELRALVPRLADPVAFPVEVRVAAADDVWLSTAYQRPCAYIAVHQYSGMNYSEYFTKFEQIAFAAGGRPHWGKLHSLGAETLRKLYPRFDDFCAVRATVDPHGIFSNAYIDRVLGPVT